MSRSERRSIADSRFERFERDDNLIMRELRMKSMAVNTKYLNSPIASSDFSYEILRQSVVIALCAVYGASIFNGKSGPFG